MTEPSLVEEQSCWHKWNTSRDREAGDELLRAYLPLVNYHVQRISVGLPKSVNKDELRSLGMLGLYDALKSLSRNVILNLIHMLLSVLEVRSWTA